jgi:tellurite resistance protein
VRLLIRAAPAARSPNPTLHLSFVGFIVGGVGAAALGRDDVATALLYATMPVALVIWAISAVDFVRRVPPAPLRPLLAIHLAPAALMTTVASLTGHEMMAQGLVALAGALFVALVLGVRWLLAGGFSAMWGALTFPLAAMASALILTGWTNAGLAVLGAALAVVPWIAWRILTLWPDDRLAAKTNAAEA